MSVPEIFALLIVLGLTVLIGHGLWVFVAWLLRALLGLSESTAQPATRQCVFCNAMTFSGERCCQRCGRDLEGEQARQLTELSRFRQSLGGLQAAGLFTAEEKERLASRAEELCRQLQALPSPAVPEAAVDAVIVEEPLPASPAAPPQRPAQPRPARPLPLEPRPAMAPAVASRPSAAEPEAPAPVSRSWSAMLAEFMEPHNIRWGELLGGLLFIVGTAALLASQWQALQQHWLFRFGVSAAVTAAVFGAGWYAYHRWRLEATGRALLTIFTMLVPLNFLAMGEPGQSGPWLLSGGLELAALAIFAWFLTQSGRVLVPGAARLQAAVVTALSALVLVLAHRWRILDPQWTLTASGCLAALGFAGGAGIHAARCARSRRLSARRTAGLLNLTGTTGFALAVALGLAGAAVYQAVGADAMLHRLAMPVALSAGLMLMVGLVVLQHSRPGTRMENHRLAGRWLALAAGSAMLGALGLAWPVPAWIIAVGSLCMALLAGGAFWFRLPILHAGAMACAALVYLVAVFLIRGEVALAPTDAPGLDLLRLFATAPAGTGLVGLCALLGLLAEWLARRSRAEDARAYGVGAGVVALASLMLVTWASPADAARAAVIYALYGVGALVVNLRLRRGWLTCAGLVLLSGQFGWLLWWYSQRIEPWWAVCLASWGLAMALAAILLARLPAAAAARPNLARLLDLLGGEAEVERVYLVPLWRMTEVLAAAALTLAVATAWLDRAFLHDHPAPCIAALAIALLYSLMGWQTRSEGRVWLASAVLGVGFVHSLVWNYEMPVLSWQVALLGHATLTALAAAAAAWYTGTNRFRHFAGQIDEILVRPLRSSAAVSSVIAALLLIVPPWTLSTTFCCCAFWLAIVWLVLAIQQRSPEWLGAHQAAFAWAIGVAIVFWYERLPGANDWLTPVQAVGCGLTLLALVWLGLRLVLRSRPAADRLLNPGWPMLDRLLKHATIAGALIATVPGVMLGSLSELISGAAPKWFAAVIADCFCPGAWVWLGLAAVVLGVSLWERWAEAEVFSAVLLVVAASGLAAGQFLDAVAVGSALRWGLALSFLAVALILWERKPIAGWLQTTGCRIMTGHYAPNLARATALVVGALPVLVLTLLAAAVRFLGERPEGPVEGMFKSMGPMASYVVPLVLLVACLVGHAVRERSPGYAFSAGLVAKLAVVLGYGLWLVTRGETLHGDSFVCLLELLTLTAGLWALGWLSVRRWISAWTEGGSGSLSRILMTLQVSIGVAVCAMLLGLVLLVLLLPMPHVPGWIGEAGRPLAWLGLLAVAMAAGWHLFRTEPSRVFHVIAALATGCALLGVCLVAHVRPHRPDLIVQATMFGLVGASFMVLLVGRQGREGVGWLLRRRETNAELPEPLPAWKERLASQWAALRPTAPAVELWVDLLVVTVVALAFRWSLEDAIRQRTVLGAILTLSAIQGCLALWLRQPRAAYVSGLLLNVAVSIVCIQSGTHSPAHLAHLNSLALAVAGAAWGLVELAWPRQIAWRQGPPLAHMAVFAAVVIEALAVALCVVAAAAGTATASSVNRLFELGSPWPVRAQMAIAVALLISLWDRSARFSLWGVYLLGLSALGSMLVNDGQLPLELAWQTAPALGLFVLAAAAFPWLGMRLDRLASAARIPVAPDRWSLDWFLPAQAFLAAVATMLSMWVAIDPHFDRLGYHGWGWLAGRWFGPAAAAALLPASVLMGGMGPRKVRMAWRDTSFAILVLLLAGCGWAWLDGEITLPWTHRGVILLIAAVAAMLAAGGLVRLVRADSLWRTTARRVLPALAALAATVLVLVLGQEFCYLAGESDSPLALWAEWSVVVMLAAMLAGCLLAALAPGWDPLGLPLRGRTLYVYLAEVCLVLLALHVRLAFPELFTRHLLQRYGLFLAMVLAFCWVGLSEIFRRRGVAVLAEPLERTALLLPVLPMMAFWFVPVRPTAVWFLIALFYGSVAAMRRSVWLGALAVAAANVGLWILWHRWEIGLLEHPQLWLIPPALAALIAERLGRGRLRDQQGVTIRYLALAVIYLSSTADMFIAGIGNSFWLPLVLLGLSLLGIFTGIGLRLQSFLYLGTAFLLVVLATMLKYVTLDLGQTWVLWVTVIALGTTILAAVGLFEKHRNDIRPALRRLRQWDR